MRRSDLGAATRSPHFVTEVTSYLAFWMGLVPLGFSTKRWVLVCPLLLASACHPILKNRVRISLGIMGFAALTLPFAILSAVWPFISRSGLNLNVVFYGVLYLATVALAQLYSVATPAVLPRVLVCLGSSLAVAGSDIPAIPFIALVSLFAVTGVVGLRAVMAVRMGTASRTGLYWGVLLGSFLLSAGFAVGIIFFLMAYYETLVRWTEPAAMSKAGFTESARIGSVLDLQMQDLKQRIMIRAYSQDEPGYLRGNVFTVYDNSFWSVDPKERAGWPLSPQETEDGLNRFVLPGRHVPEAETPPAMSVFPPSQYGTHFFLPLDAAGVDTGSSKVSVYAGNALRSEGRSTSAGYLVHMGAGPVFEVPLTPANATRPGTKGSDREAVAIPSTLRMPDDDELTGALDSVVRAQFSALMDGPAPEQAVQAIAEWFDAHYEYKFGIKFRGRSDPLVQFLTTQDHGHCELFASVGCLLLRRLGIPARYVTGFLCREKNAFGDMWVARACHAHAWVEYWTEDRGWRVAEFTPSDGLPPEGVNSGIWAFLDHIRGEIGKALGAITRRGIAGALKALRSHLVAAGQWALGAWWRIAALGALSFAFLMRRFRGRARRERLHSLTMRTLPASLEAQRKKLLRLEKQLRSRGLGRREDETLEEYATRLQGSEIPDRTEIADFIRTYSGARYAPFEGRGEA